MGIYRIPIENWGADKYTVVSGPIPWPLGWLQDDGVDVGILLSNSAAYPGPYSGTRYFGGGESAAVSAYIVAPVPSVVAAQAAAGSAKVLLTFQQASGKSRLDPTAADGFDPGSISLDFYDDATKLSGSGPAALAYTTLGWHARSHIAAVPAGTNLIRVVYSATRTRDPETDGEACNCFVDDIGLLLWAPSNNAPIEQAGLAAVTGSGGLPGTVNRGGMAAVTGSGGLPGTINRGSLVTVEGATGGMGSVMRASVIAVVVPGPPLTGTIEIPCFEVHVATDNPMWNSEPVYGLFRVMESLPLEVTRLNASMMSLGAAVNALAGEPRLIWNGWAPAEGQIPVTGGTFEGPISAPAFFLILDGVLVPVLVSVAASLSVPGLVKRAAAVADPLTGPDAWAALDDLQAALVASGLAVETSA